METKNRWTRFFFKIAQDYAEQSKDPSTKVGSVLAQGKYIVGAGYNGLPPHMEDDPEILNNRELRLAMTLHAEDNTLFGVDREKSKDCSIFITAPPCAGCSALLLRASVAKVHYLKAPDDFMERWGKNIEFGLDKLRKSGVIILAYDKEQLL